MAMGASGLVFMLIFLSAVSGQERGKVPLTLILVAIVYLGREVADGLFRNDNISQLAHIAGGLCGFGFGMLAPKKRAR
jgi:membrane associated rhomboid family serine protease